MHTLSCNFYVYDKLVSMTALQIDRYSINTVDTILPRRVEIISNFSDFDSQ